MWEFMYMVNFKAPDTERMWVHANFFWVLCENLYDEFIEPDTN
jgi:hypothetical protein